MTTADTLTIVLAKAARSAGSPAARDYSALYDSGARDLTNAVFSLATERVGVPLFAVPRESRDAVDAEQAAIWAEIQDGLTAHLEQARQRGFTGWSRHSTAALGYAKEA